jgi:hypothetical protein
MSIDRLELIRQAAEKYQFKTKLQAKTRKVKVKRGRKAKAPVEAVDDGASYDDERTIRKVVHESGLVDTFAYTTRFDNEWN